jgi:hypothetical protein
MSNQIRFGRQSVLAACLLATLSLSGCATLNEQECRTADWRTVGYEDGVAGYTGDRIGQHRKACAKYGVTADLTRYQQGRADGLREYCQPTKGFQLGESGSSYNGVCPAESSDAFLDAYDAGRQLYSLRQRVTDVNNDIREHRDDLEETREEVEKHTRFIASNESTGEQRVKALADLKRAQERIGRLKAEMRQLEYNRVEFERDLEDYQARMTYPMR